LSLGGGSIDEGVGGGVWGTNPGQPGLIGEQLEMLFGSNGPPTRSGVAPRARAFRIIGAHRWTRRIGWVIRAFVSHGWTTIGRSRSQGQRAVVHAIGSDCKADQRSSGANGSGNDADRPGRFPRPPLDCSCAYIA